MKSFLRNRRVRGCTATLGAFCLAACGGGGGVDEASAPPGPGAAYTVGGTVSGLSGAGLVLQFNGTNDLHVQSDGSFAFSGTVGSGSIYTVSVLVPPARPSQTCTVSGGSGTASANVTTVEVHCATDPMTLLAVDPADRSGEVTRHVQPALTFSAALDAATLSNATVTLFAAGGPVVPATLTPAAATVGIVPSSLLWPDTEYRIGVNGVRGSFGEPLAGPVDTGFVTRDGQWQNAPVLPLRTVASFDDESHRLAVAPDGTAMAAWLLPDGANQSRLWASRRGADGRWQAPAEVGPAVPGHFGYPALALAPDGTAHAVWSSELGIGSRQQVFASRRGPADADWSAPVQLSDNTVSSNVEPMLGVGANGAVYATWVAAGNPYDIHVVQRQDDGTWSAPVVANEANGRSVFSPAVAVRADGHAMLVWIEQNGADYALKWRAYRPDVSAPEALAPAADVGGPSGQATRFSLALNAAGDGALAWQLGSGATRTIWASIKGVIVAEWGPALALDGDATEDRSPQVAVDEIGDVIAVWEGAEPGGPNRVFSRRWERGSSGVRSAGGWSDLRQLSDGAGGGNAAVGIDARGNGLVLWQPSNSAVRSARFTRRQGWQPAAPVAELGAAGSIFVPRIGFDGSGSAVAIWVETDMLLRTAGPSFFGLGGARFD